MPCIGEGDICREGTRIPEGPRSGAGGHRPLLRGAERGSAAHARSPRVWLPRAFPSRESTCPRPGLAAASEERVSHHVLAGALRCWGKARVSAISGFPACGEPSSGPVPSPRAQPQRTGCPRVSRRRAQPCGGPRGLGGEDAEIRDALPPRF
uniref:Uncharacterized protein n=1 Tax=Rousettus aegyptiacus TaxID=9407 RepID=A0A7J8HQR8_ROUAE|nr:hypothetical protein HJG63_010868 [Rousettus aegyptiacus]